MQIKCEEMIREVDNRIAAIDLNGNHIIRDCKTMLLFLKEKLPEGEKSSGSMIPAYRVTPDLKIAISW